MEEALIPVLGMASSRDCFLPGPSGAGEYLDFAGVLR